jgi:small GTP-binding protein
MIISKKVILTGSFGVGKSSLFRRFIHSTFDERYLTTIGVKVDKKTIDIDGREMTMLIWDIAGEVTQDKVPTSYFLGADGIIYVFDLTRETTMQNIQTDLDYLQKLLPNAAYKTVGNKKDRLSAEQIADFPAQYGFEPDLFTSAKTGENVEQLFQLLGIDLLKP